MRERNFAVIGALAGMLMLATACSSSSSTTSAGVGATSTSPTATAEAPTDVTGKATFEVEVDSFYFAPSALDGSAGQQITLTLKNESSTTHTFTIDDQNVDVTLAPGAEEQVDVTFPQSGSALFYCRFHKTSGMTGTLEVM